MTRAQRRANDPPDESMEAFMARRMREVTGFRGGFREITPVLARTLMPGPTGQVVGAVLEARRRSEAAQVRQRVREIVPARRPAEAPVRSVAKVASAPARPVPTAPGRIETWLDESPEAKAIAGDLTRWGAVGPGVARGAWRLVEDTVDGAAFGARLLNGFDPDQQDAAWEDVSRVAGAGVGFARDAVSDPSTAVVRVKGGLEGWAEDLSVKTDPKATPVADTFRGEVDRQFGIGLNQGGLLFDAATLPVGGAAIKGLSRMGTAARGLKTVDHYVAKGVPPSIAAYFVEPYTGMGHHYLPRRTRLPVILGGGPVPPVISESPFFLLKPEGIQRGDMYELHYRVDPHFNGGKVPRRIGNVKGWSGKKLGWEKEDSLGQVWYGAPDPLKATAAGALGTGLVGFGAWVDEHDGEERRR